jgi:nucleoside-diphosphate-sugar epimerase
MGNNLVIGETSQLAYYFPAEYVKISSRNVDVDYLRSQPWDAVYLTFAEQRIYDVNIDYETPNYTYTLALIEAVLDTAQKIVVYSSCDLWNQCSGEITLATPFNYRATNDYLPMKEKLVFRIQELRQTDPRYQKVVIIHPFYFNSGYRSSYFLFGKIFESIRQHKKIELGNTYFYRDMVHTTYMVHRSILATQDEIVGAGRLYHVNDFIRDLYFQCGLKYEDFVTENIVHNTRLPSIFYAKQNQVYSYKRLLQDTVVDLDTMA